MARKNPHIGSSFESWLNEAGIREEVTAAATKAVIARQLASEMKKKKITKQRMAELMKTSRAQVDRLLDPDNGSATIESLQRAARIVGRGGGALNKRLRHQQAADDGDAERPAQLGGREPVAITSGKAPSAAAMVVTQRSIRRKSRYSTTNPIGAKLLDRL